MPLPKLGLRARLVLILLVAFSGLACFIIWNSQLQRAEQRQAAGEHLLGEARLLAARQQVIMARADAILNNAMLAGPVPGRMAADHCARLLAGRLAPEPAFLGLGAAAPDGRVLCATPAGESLGSLAKLPWFRQALATRGMVISDVSDNPDSPRIILAKALRDPDGQVRSVFFLTLDLAAFEHELLQSKLLTEAHLAVTDALGNVFIRFADSGAPSRQHQPDLRPIWLGMGTPEGVMAATGLDGTAALLAYTPLLQAGADVQYRLVLSQPTADIDAHAQQQLINHLALALIFLIASLALVHLGSHYYLMRPIKALAHSARRFGSGDLAIARSQLSREDEFAELWRSFEEMANSLRAGTVSRERLQAEMENLRRAEDRLQLNQMTLSQATHIARLGVWSVGPLDLDNFACIPVQWSARMYQILDYRPEDLPYPTVADFLARLHPEDRTPIIDTILAALAEKRPWQAEYRVLAADGSERLVMEVGEVSYDAAGRPCSLLGAIMDITQQRRAEATLRDNTARLRLALEGASAGTYEWNVETGVTTWSDELQTLCGLAPEVDTTPFAAWRKVVHPYDLERVEAIIEDAVAGQASFEVEWRLNSPDGNDPHWVLERANPVVEKDGRTLRYLGIIIDISKHKQTELSLKRYREHLEEMVQARTAELSRAEAEQRRLNRALRLLSDCNIALVRAASEQELLDNICRLIVDTGGYQTAWFAVADPGGGRTLRLIAHAGYAAGDTAEHPVLPEYTEERYELTGLAIRTGSVQVAQNCQHRQPWPAAAEPQKKCRSCVALPIHTRDGIHGALTLHAAEAQAFGPEELALLDELAANVSFGLQSLEASNELERYRQNLEQRVAERTHEIAQLNLALAQRADEAESASRAKGDFLATMSHELRTPLNAVTGLSRLLADTLTDRRQRNYTDKIQNAAQVLCTLIDDILDLSKIEAGSLQLEQAPFELDTVLQAAAAVLSGGIRGKEIEAFFDIAPGIPKTLIGDALRLQQILLNLCSNAIKFTERGSIVITVRLLAGPAGQATLQFAVRDTGVGIPPEKLSRIFEVFTQADSSTSRKYGGTGLGLAISARLVGAMGGCLNVDSEPDQGSEFTFTVTLDLPPPTPVPATDTSLPALRVLIVDDQPLGRDILQRTCAGFGWQATAVASAAAGLDALQAGPAGDPGYDLLLLDWHMPETSGLDMLRQARERPGVALPLVVLMVPGSELAQAAAAGDDLYLDGIVTKPLTPAALFEAVHQAYHGEPPQLPALPGTPDRRLDGLRLLVAEDNELNQEMVEQILTRAGAAVAIAANGRLAVDMLEAPGARFDAVLMDIQMPVMDGYAATRIIREQLGLRELPIIAVTAHARPEDREKSRQAGMAGHIVKPVDVDDLLALLGGIERQPRPPAKDAPPAADDRLPGLNLAAIRRTGLGHDLSAYAGLLRKFVTQHAGDIERAQQLFAGGDRAGAIKLVHDLRGVAGYLGAEDVARLAARAESALQEQLPGSEALFGELQQAMATLHESLVRLESGLPAAVEHS